MDADKSWKSLSRIIDWVLPPVIVGYSCWGLYMSIFHVGIGWLGCHNNRPAPAVIYIILSMITVSTIVGLIVFLWTLPPSHDTPPRLDHAAAQFWFDKFPRECLDEAGTLARCHKGHCAGRVKPPRSHHCSVCQTCRVEWDHHCPWVGCCLTIRQSKSFLMLLAVTAFGVCFMAAPVIQPIIQGAEAMYAVSRSDARCKRFWWDWWGSYVVFGGPGGRWILGTALGYWIAEHDIPSNPRQCRYGQPIMSPRVSSALTLVTALCLSGFCLVLAIQMGFHLLKGQTTIEALQSGTLVRKADASPSRFIWIPSRLLNPLVDSLPITHIPHADAECGGVRLRAPIPAVSSTTHGMALPVEASLRTYDLGVRKNVQVFFSRPLLWSTPSSENALREPPEINPKIIELIKRTQVR